MRAYAECEVFTNAQLDVLRAAQNIVDQIEHRRLPSGEIDWDHLRCHEVARIVGRALSLDVVDGHYGACDHSWIELRSATGRGHPVILDVYCVGASPMVQLRDHHVLGCHNFYRPGMPRMDIHEEAVNAELARLCLDQVGALRKNKRTSSAESVIP